MFVFQSKYSDDFKSYFGNSSNRAEKVQNKTGLTFN